MSTTKSFIFTRRANRWHTLLRATLIGFTLFGATAAFADNAVKLKVLVISTGDITTDPGLAYITPVLDEMGISYDILNAVTTGLTAATLSPASCLATTVGCVGNYNGTILTSSDLAGNFTAAEWIALHEYETNFHVREAVLSGWPSTGWDPTLGTYLDYGLIYSSSPVAPYNAQWTADAIAKSKQIFEYVNMANPLPITDFAFAAVPINNGFGRDNTLPNVVPLLKTPPSATYPNGEALVSIVQYIPYDPAVSTTVPVSSTPAREVLFSTITNAGFLIHSQALAYEFVNWATQGVYVGGRAHYMAAHLDDLFIPDEIWNPTEHKTDPGIIYRLNSNDINNAVIKQASFRSAHPTAGNGFKLDFPFNGTGAVVDPAATPLVANLTEDLVKSVVANKTQFRYINHTFTHADMDKVPVPANPGCDYPTLSTTALIQAEITKNRTVWGLLGLPEQAQNNRILVSGNHSGLKDRKCTDYPELHPEMANVQSDDIPFVVGANPLFVTAAKNAGVDYLASDSSQLNQAIEQQITTSGGKVVVTTPTANAANRTMSPRWPANVFYNTIDPVQLTDEYNYIFYTLNGDPLNGGISAPRTYQEILTAEADAALRHILTLKKWPHFFHQTNLAAYDVDGNTLQFDWLNAVYNAYEKLFKLPLKNLPYYQIGDLTKNNLIAKSATINATWDRTTNRVSISANKNIASLLVTGINSNGTLYGGQRISNVQLEANKNRTFPVDQALTK